MKLVVTATLADEKGTKRTYTFKDGVMGFEGDTFKLTYEDFKKMVRTFTRMEMKATKVHRANFKTTKVTE